MTKRKLGSILLLFSLVLSVGLYSACSDREIRPDGVAVEGHYFPNEKIVNGKKLGLNNAAPLKISYMGLPIKILAVGLYTEGKILDSETMLKDEGTKHFEFRVLDYDLAEDENTEGWKRTFRKSCIDDCGSTDVFDEISAGIGGAKRQVGSWTFTLTPDSTTVDAKTDKAFNKKFAGSSIGKNILAIYWGPKASSEYKALGQMLLGSK
jgi:hypothetical protein